MHEMILGLLKSADTFAAAEEVQKDGSSVEVAKRYEQLVLNLYWKAKDLPAVVIMSHFGLSYCLTNARQGDHATWLLDSAKKIAYNLASFCWPGWDEPGITISEGDIQIGSDAAKLNLRLAIELNRPPLGMSMAYWMLGGYALVFRDFRAAAARFTQGIELAGKAQDEGQVSSNEGFLALSRIGQNDPSGEAEFARVLEQLEIQNTDDSKEYARQLRVARRVFQL